MFGKRWAWMAGWIYGWALFTTLAAIATGAGPYIAQLFGLEASPVMVAIIGLALIALVTLLNLSATRLLARVAMFGFICELPGGNRGRQLPADLRPLSAIERLDRNLAPASTGHELLPRVSRLIARRDVLLLRLRSLQRCRRGDAEPERDHPEVDAFDHLPAALRRCGCAWDWYWQCRTSMACCRARTRVRWSHC